MYYIYRCIIYTDLPVSDKVRKSDYPIFGVEIARARKRF